MDLTTRYNFEELTNTAERLVIAEMGTRLAPLVEAYKVPEGLLLDVAAYALNNLPAMYRVTLMGRLYAQSLSGESDVEVRRAVQTAIEKIVPEYFRDPEAIALAYGG